MEWNGVERRSGGDRRRSDRRSAISFSISLILNGSASRRSGTDRRQHARRSDDRRKLKLPVDQAPGDSSKTSRPL
ncbi:MAG TPA: hypothetical protein VFC63_06660 [Blastocatellia bacterium]|nr:hypothetical protein [Blastocatellia bacterium]